MKILGRARRVARRKKAGASATCPAGWQRWPGGKADQKHRLPGLAIEGYAPGESTEKSN